MRTDNPLKGQREDMGDSLLMYMNEPVTTLVLAPDRFDGWNTIYKRYTPDQLQQTVKYLFTSTARSVDAWLRDEADKDVRSGIFAARHSQPF
jgi:hypothetical protein